MAHQNPCEPPVCPYGELLHRMSDQMDRLEHRIIGNGAPGVMTRLDRLEVASRKSQWMKNTVTAAAITIICTAGAWFVWDVLRMVTAHK